MEENEKSDYMFASYDLIAEPLNLKISGRAWYLNALNIFNKEAINRSLVLGAVTWMAEALSSVSTEVTVVDASQKMLAKAGGEFDEKERKKIALCNCDWMSLPNSINELDLVVGDNSITYLQYPMGWHAFLEQMHGRLSKKGTLAIRLFAVPTTHVKQSFSEIAKEYYDVESLNYTEIRTRLLFAKLDEVNYSITTEDVLAEFIRTTELFEPLIGGRDSRANDLLSIYKYKNTAAIYYAPPISEVKTCFENYFDVVDIHYGPYKLSEYFPLIIARKI